MMATFIGINIYYLMYNRTRKLSIISFGDRDRTDSKKNLGFSKTAFIIDSLCKQTGKFATRVMPNTTVIPMPNATLLVR